MHKYMCRNVLTGGKAKYGCNAKMGCLGSQKTQFKQTFQNGTDSDSNIFQNSLVLAYKIPLKMRQTRAADDKRVVKSKNQEEMGLLVDVPKTGFLWTPNPLALLGVNIDLIKLFDLILEVNSSGNYIDVDQRDNLCSKIAKYNNITCNPSYWPTVRRGIGGPQQEPTAIQIKHCPKVLMG